jgi:hypothetical protein
MPGYEDLDDHGHWRAAGGYGEVWYPSDVPPDWVPYRYGSWGWVEPWGWTWVENEPWGFCPFHYGRWAFIGGAWGWVPGPVAVMPLYSPALVAFVGGSGFSLGFSFGSAGVAAWFPLGPGEPFIPWYHYSSGYLRQVNVTNVRNVTNVTNITTLRTSAALMNQNVATTVVPAGVLRTRQPVARQAIRASPQQIAREQVIAHPSVTPAPQIARGGKAAPPPQIRPPKIAAAPQTVRKHAPASVAGKPSQPPPISDIFLRFGMPQPMFGLLPGLNLVVRFHKFWSYLRATSSSTITTSTHRSVRFSASSLAMPGAVPAFLPACPPGDLTGALLSF